MCNAIAMHIYPFIRHKIDAIQMYCSWSDDGIGKLKIPDNPPTVNKTIRFPSDVVEGVENAIVEKDCTFSAFVIAAVRAALEDLEG